MPLNFTPPADFYCPITGELMVIPVTDNDGISYEESAIIEWLKHKKVSPMTRNPLLHSDLRKNISLKNSIDSIRDKLNADQLKIKSQICEAEMIEFVDALNDIKLGVYFKNDKVFINIKMPNVPKRPPTDIAICIDVSGSMGSEAVLQGENGEKLNYGISVLSLTICAAKTILNSLDENDNISIITYTDKSSVIVDCWTVSNQNKIIIEKMLDELTPLRTTNIWDGIKTSLDVLRTKSPKNRMKGLFLLTDGVPNIEPSHGHEYMLNKYFDDYQTFKCMINCYGFGYNLKSNLLQNISNISGGDGFAFIPDSSLLGNIFIHGLSNFLTTAAFCQEMKITLTDGFVFNDGSTEKNVKVNSLKYGQDKNLCIDYKYNTQVCDTQSCLIEMKIGEIDIKQNFNIEHEYICNQECRFNAISCIDNCIKEMKFNEKDNVKLCINNFLEASKKYKSCEYIDNIIFDFEGQIKEALNMTNTGEKEDWFNKWGIHYLRSLSDAYKNEVCNNFKDKGVSNFGGKIFNELRNTISDIFDTMPPPKSVIQTYSRATPVRGVSQNSLAPLSTMASYNTQYIGGCCARGSMIKMNNKTYKKVEDVKNGDEIITVNILDGKITYGKSLIECVVITKCKNGKEFMVELGKLKITPYHPIYSVSKWKFPINISSPKEIDCKDMFTFVTKDRNSVIVDDYIFATYGHNMKGDIIEHDYFGSEKVIKDLKRFNTYDLGYVNLKKSMFYRNGKIYTIR